MTQIGTFKDEATFFIKMISILSVLFLITVSVVCYFDQKACYAYSAKLKKETKFEWRNDTCYAKLSDNWEKLEKPLYAFLF